MSRNAAADTYARQVLRHFGPDPANWVRPNGTDHDVVIVGGGQAGLGIGFALRRAGIARFSVIDAAAPHEAGVWTTTARMHVLRTPKNWPEPEFGFAELSFQAWYELLHGQAAYDALPRIPRQDWADYIEWIEQHLGVAVRHHTRLTDIRPGTDSLELTLTVRLPDGTESEVVETTRKLVLANGVEGTGGPYLPPELRGLTPDVLAHTGQRIDFSGLTGKSVAVLGAAASAFDAAAVALESGAREVHLFARRPDLLVQGEAGYGPANVGARDNYRRLGDAQRWAQQVQGRRKGRTAPLAAVTRAAALPGLHIHLSAPWYSTSAEGGGVRVEAADGSSAFDFVIAGTGYQYDPATRDELKRIAPDIALWADVYQPPADLADDHLGRTPYLGDGYQLTERTPGRAPWLGRTHVFSAAATLSFGYPIGDVQSLAPDIPQLVRAIGRDLFFEDLQLPARPVTAHESQSLREYYVHAIWSPELEPSRS